MKRARYQRGTVDADPRTRKLYFRWYEKSGKRRAEYVGDFSSPKRLVEAATTGTVSMQANRNKQQG